MNSSLAPEPLPASSRKASPHRSQIVEIAAATGLVLWRALAVPPGRLWRDWLLILAAYWMFSVLVSGRRAWGAITLGVAAFLLGLYLSGQVPLTLKHLGLTM